MIPGQQNGSLNRQTQTAMHRQVAEDHGFTAIADVDILDADGSMELPVWKKIWLALTLAIMTPISFFPTLRDTRWQVLAERSKIFPSDLAPKRGNA